MALLNRLDQGTDSYILDLTNDDAEQLLDDDNHSSASQFTILLNPTLDLSSLLYLRSVAAEIAISQLSVDALPLTGTNKESITVKVDVPTDVVSSNSWFNSIAMSGVNNTLLEIPCRNFYTTDPDEVIQHTNNLLQEGITQFILYRYLCAYLDLDIFTTGSLQSLSVTDLALLGRYIDIAMYTRNVMHDTMVALVPDMELANVEGREIMTHDKDGMSRNEEARHLARSGDVFRATADRNVSEQRKTIDFDKFYSVTIGQGVDEAIIQSIKTSTLSWLQDIGIITRNEEGALIVAQENRATMESYIKSNQLLTQMGLKCREIVGNLRTLIDKRKTKVEAKRSSFFVYCFLSLYLDPDTQLKCRFHMENEKYITNDGTAITVKLPEQISYILGAKSGQCVTIGPIDRNTAIANKPTLNHTILSEDQRLFHRLRPLPQVIHVVSDLVFSKSRDMWLANTPWRNYHLIYTFVLSASNIARHYICQINNTRTYYRVQDVNSILESFSFVMLDQSFRRILFEPHCKVAMRLIIRPVTYGSS